MNNSSGGQYSAYIGIDWADTKHDICLQAAKCDENSVYGRTGTKHSVRVSHQTAMSGYSKAHSHPCKRCQICVTSTGA